MSKNRNYGNYYKNPLKEEPKEEIREEAVEVEEVHTEEPTPEPEPVAFETEVTPKAVIQKTLAVVTGAKSVNLRADASKEAPIITAIPEKTAVKILEKSNQNWYRIEVNDKIGFMMSKYLKEIK